MIEISGAHGSAVVHAETLAEGAAAQLRKLCDMPFTAGSRIRVMPDVHEGAGCTIGTTMTISDSVVPNLVGVDIGCGMETRMLDERRIDLPKLDSLIRSRIPAGMTVRESAHRLAEEIDLTALRCAQHVDLRRASLSIGTLGGGNHFIEVDRAEDGRLWLVVHSGSRRLGLEVANWYQDEAWRRLNRNSNEDLAAMIADLKAAGRSGEIERRLREAREQVLTDVPHPLAHAVGALFEDYLHDMRIVQRFAQLNRQAMADEIVRGMKLDVADAFATIHNYIDLDAMILRKGAVSAKAGERLLVPINMRDGSLVCTGLGNPEWNESAPHGAGRLFSRSEARNRFTVNEFRRQMDGVFTTTVGRETLDECPMAYKDMDSIVRQIAPTARVEQVIRPVYNFKAGE